MDPLASSGSLQPDGITADFAGHDGVDSSGRKFAIRCSLHTLMNISQNRQRDTSEASGTPNIAHHFHHIGQPAFVPSPYVHHFPVQHSPFVGSLCAPAFSSYFPSAQPFHTPSFPSFTNQSYIPFGYSHFGAPFAGGYAPFFPAAPTAHLFAPQFASVGRSFTPFPPAPQPPATAVPAAVPGAASVAAPAVAPAPSPSQGPPGSPSPRGGRSVSGASNRPTERELARLRAASEANETIDVDGDTRNVKTPTDARPLDDDAPPFPVRTVADMD